MAYKKVIRKVAKKVGRAVKGRYFKGKGYSNPKIGQMVKDISVLKGMLNAEKKRIEVPISTGQLVGQVNSAASGHWLADLTPNVTQGSGFNQKTGNSFKWVSSFLDFQFQQQANVSSPIRLKIEIVKVVGLPYTTVSDVLGKYIEPTAFTSGTIYDIHSPRDPDYFKNFIVLKRKFVYMPMDNTSGQLMLKRVKMGIKYRNHHVRTNNNDPTITMGQVFILITADNGNTNPTTTSTITGIPNAGVSTGSTFLGEFTHYYYDN